ncbi:MAG: TIGR02710 family CRISPR-associated protein [Nitrospinae bacterium]|nr:TIGR02710 family CRISPR-associated protein [Nitrospinota bacterium]MBF0633513.1 TIGR02710 family CRISPR-associated protein [Nitrospinota bacterium]
MSNKALILTIGTGNVDELETSLLTPLQKSISKGEWQKVVLLPSQITKKFAGMLQDRIGSAPIEISPLPKAKQEDDADSCFAHFDEVMNGLHSQGYLNQNIVADFTRGTKAMSAALVLAAVRHEIPVLRYITSDRRDNRGQVVSGQEMINEISTTTATGQQKLDTALRFISSGAFAAVLELLPDPANSFAKIGWPEKMLPQLSAIRSMAEFYSSWEKFDYPSAFRIAEAELDSWTKMKKDFANWKEYFPNKEMRKWVQNLSEPLTKAHKSKSPILRKIAADLLANAERRVRDNQLEDAVIRAYRIRELIAQIRLFDNGIDSDDVQRDHPALLGVQDKLKKDGRQSWHTGEGGRYQASREKAAMLLTALGDKMGAKLLKENRESLLSTKSRNNSLLIHGFRSMGNVDKKKLLSDFKEMETLIREDDPQNAQRNLELARSINFGVK